MPSRWAWCLPCFLFAAVVGRAADDGDFRSHPYDWPQWQGPERNGLSQETGLLQKWPADGPPLLWKSKGLGDGYSAPSVAAGRIFGMSFRNGDEIVWALDEKDGKELWHARIAAQKPPRSRQGNAGPHGTPTVDGDLLYAIGINADLACLEVATGKVRWEKNLAKDFGGQMMSGWGWSESPLVDGEKVVCTPGGDKASIVALNKLNGDVIWRSAVPQSDLGSRGKNGAGYSSVVVSEACGMRQYVQLLGKGVVGVAAKDGKFLWGYNKVANGVANITTPIVKDDYVFCSTAYQTGSALLKLVAADGGVKAEEVYFLPSNKLQNHHGGLVLVHGYVYGGQGQNQGFPTCVEFKTGKILWSERGPGTGSAGVAYADNRLYFRYQNGLMALIAADPAAFKVVSMFKLPDNSGKPNWPHPVIANGRLYLRDQETLLCFDVKQHE